MKLLISIVLFLPLFSVAQGLICSPEMNTLWANYPNKIEIATGSFKKKILVVSERINLVATDDKNRFIGKIIDTAKTAKIHVLSKRGKDTLYTKEFRIRRLPTPKLSLGYKFEGDTISVGDTILHCGYAPNVNYNDGTVVLNYEIVIPGMKAPFKGEGNTLTPQIQKALLEIKGQKVILVTAKINLGDGVSRQNVSTFTWINP